MSEDFPSPVGAARRLATTGLFTALLTVQVVVPLLRVGSEAPVRFGWQMFATLNSPVQFSVRYPDGRVDTIAVDDYVVKRRSEIDLPALLPAHLCRTLEDAETVVVDRGWAPQPRMEHPCP